MNKTFVTSLITISALSLSIMQLSAIPAQGEPKSLILRAETNAVNMDMVIKDNFIKAKYASAENRFLQGNVKAAHDDFADLISKASHDDYVFLAYGIKMALLPLVLHYSDFLYPDSILPLPGIPSDCILTYHATAPVYTDRF